MRSFALALQFLTVVPLPWRQYTAPSAAHFGQAVAYFPLVGLLIGLAAVPLDLLARAFWSPFVAAALVLAATIFITGALHMDGFLDTCDGLFLWNPDRRLQAMRDSRVGGFAVAGGLSLYGLKLAALGNAVGEARFACLVLAPVLSRFAVSLVLVVFPYVRATGLGNAFKEASRPVHVALAAGIAVLPALVFGAPGLAGLVFAGGMALLIGFSICRRLGGLTGDTYGFTLECVETVSLLVLTVPPLWAMLPGWPAWS